MLGKFGLLSPGKASSHSSALVSCCFSLRVRLSIRKKLLDAMLGKFVLLSPGKASSHSSALVSYFFPLRAVFSCFYTTDFEACSFTTNGYGIFNVHTNLEACRTHEGGGGGGGGGASGTNKSANVLTRRDSCPAPCPARGSNPELTFCVRGTPRRG